MKKFTAIILSVLMIFSVVSVLAFAEGETEEDPHYTVVFVNYDDTLIASANCIEGRIILAPDNPTRNSENGINYIFDGWVSSVDNNKYYKDSIPAVTCDVTYKAVYLADDTTDGNGGNITFFQLMESLFSQLNVIFEQIALFFEGLNNAIDNLFNGRTIGDLFG